MEVQHQWRRIRRPRPSVPQREPTPWWTPEPALIQKWQALHARVQKYYMCTEMPRRYAFEGQPLVVVATKEENDYVQADSLTNEAQPSDAVIRCVNESEMFLGSPYHLRDQPPHHDDSPLDSNLVASHVASYATGHQ